MNIQDKIRCYDASLPLANASTPPSAWYTDVSIAALEQEKVFSHAWLIAGRIDQLQERGQYVATEIANQPIIIVRGDSLKAFYNVCQHHAAQVMASGAGCTKALTCPYHGWSYKLDGTLGATPLFEDVCDFDKRRHGLKEIKVAVWQQWVFVCLAPESQTLPDFFGDFYHQLDSLNIAKMRFHQRVSYELNCNWKVYVDNYLDGGYHVPMLHKGLNSALDGRHYKIEIQHRYCLQSCPTKPRENEFSQVRTGTARYYWQYPNLMINLYDGVMGIMIVEPLAVDKCRVIFEYYFDNEHPNITEEFKENSVIIANKIQQEDADVCHSVQKGLASKGYETGRLSVKKEAGEHLFHRLLYQDLMQSD